MLAISRRLRDSAQIHGPLRSPGVVVLPGERAQVRYHPSNSVAAVARFSDQGSQVLQRPRGWVAVASPVNLFLRVLQVQAHEGEWIVDPWAAPAASVPSDAMRSARSSRRLISSRSLVSRMVSTPS